MHMFDKNPDLEKDTNKEDGDSEWEDSDVDLSIEGVEKLIIDKLQRIFGEDFNLEAESDEEDDFNIDTSSEDDKKVQL